MISVDQALQEVLAASQPLAAIRAPLAEAVGAVLAEDIASDIDSPPYDKSLMDGYAVRSQDLVGGTATLQVLEEVAAGKVPRYAVVPGTTTRVMTGSPVPAGADAVVMLEETAEAGSGKVRLWPSRVAPGQNTMSRATCLARDEIVLRRGMRLTPARVGLLAEVGRESVPVYGSPRVGILVTGDELVSVDQTPGPGQIRNTNGPLLAALTAGCGGVPWPLGIAPDDRQALRQLVAPGLSLDVLLLSGGVSAGKWDLVPEVLAELGAGQRFHKVALKPGKPLWFGVRESTLVFGLPGNPVSCLVCFQLFVASAIRALRGIVPPESPFQLGRLSVAFQQRSDRTTFFPGQTESVAESNGGEAIASDNLPQLRLLPWRGSADLRTVADATCLVEFPAGQQQFDPGTPVRFIELHVKQ